MNRPVMFDGAQRIVVKVGSAVLDDAGRFDRVAFVSLVRGVVDLRERGIEVVIVSSGAVALGMQRLGLSTRPPDLARLQATAAVGQGRLMRYWEDELSSYGAHAAQVLLTHDGLTDRRRYLVARQTVRAVLELGAVPVVNENDTVAVDEIRLGDNDLMSSLAVNLTGAEFLVILSDTDGLYSGDPADGDFERIDRVAHINARIEMMAGGSKSGIGRGGMRTKIEAIRQVNHIGVSAIIAGGKTPRVLRRLYAGEKLGTWFDADIKPVTHRKHWIAYAQRPSGVIHVDTGAERALLNQGRSLLSVGVTRVDGAFGVGDLISIAGPSGAEFARGLVGHSASDVGRIAGMRSDEALATLGIANAEIVHRDDLVRLPMSIESETEPSIGDNHASIELKSKHLYDSE